MTARSFFTVLPPSAEPSISISAANFDDFLTKKDKYSYFLGGNHGICKIENKSLENGKKMLKELSKHCEMLKIAGRYSAASSFDIEEEM